MAKYKFSLSSRVRGMIEWNLEHYPEYKKSLEQYKTDMIPSTTQQLRQTEEKAHAGYVDCIDPLRITSHNASRATENTALSIATSPYIMHTERCIRAVDRALESCDSTTLKLIDLVYWKRTHSVDGAAYVVNLTKTPAYKRINNILCIIGLEMGYFSI